jgi:hypothetical protein
LSPHLQSLRSFNRTNLLEKSVILQYGESAAPNQETVRLSFPLKHTHFNNLPHRHRSLNRPLSPFLKTGVRMLRDGREDTYWQSDGAQPHMVTLEFQKLVLLSGLALYIDYKLDESYTPQKISIRAGTRRDDMKEVKSVDLVEPQGWVLIPLTHEDTGLYV